MEGEEDMPKLEKYGKNGRQKLKPKMERGTWKILLDVQHADLGAADRFAHSAGPGNLELRDDLDVWDIWDILDVEDVQDVLDVFDNIMET